VQKDRDRPPWWEVNPAHDFDASALVLTFCIGDDRDPDEVFDIRGSGDFRVEAGLRDDVRQILLSLGLTADELDVQETRMPPQGTGMAAMFETWVQAMPPNVLGSVIGGAIMAGCAKLWNKYHKRTPAQQPQPTVTVSISPEDLFSKHAGGIIAQHYSINETLTDLNLVITQTYSPYSHSGSVDKCESTGRTFHVEISSPADGLRVTHIIREHPEA
jgi:hypothetical protein